MNIQKVIKGLECCKVGCKDCPYFGEQECILKVRDDALEVLKEQCRFMEFLYNVINPNKMEAYLRMYLALPIPTNGEKDGRINIIKKEIPVVELLDGLAEE